MRASCVDLDIIVDGESQNFAHFLPQGLHAVLRTQAVELIKVVAVFLPHAVDEGVAGQGDQRRRLVHRVVGEDHHGIGAAAHLVGGHQEEGIGVRPPGAALRLRGGGAVRVQGIRGGHRNARRDVL